MQQIDIGNNLLTIIEQNFEEDSKKWFFEKLNVIIEKQSVQDLYLTYSLCGRKFPEITLETIDINDADLQAYLTKQQTSHVQLSRIFLLIRVLQEDYDFFEARIQSLIQVADKTELETFLKYLILLPNPQSFRSVAVDALRTNIATVFDAISQNNPYPGLYFNDLQWNQMFLKATFMERTLEGIENIDKRANKDLSRIISDYAHERWAASRRVDPTFWRPVTNFLVGTLLDDMKRLFESQDIAERRAAALCCFYSNKSEAKKLLEEYPDLKENIASNTITWENFKT